MKSMVLVLAATVAMAQSPVPRPAPEWKFVQNSGKATALSAYRGRVILLAFISTQCGHCQRASQVFEQLSHEFGTQLQVTEAAFDEGADVAAFGKRFGLTFPVSRCTGEEARAFLGIPANGRLGTPQVVVIDRAGVIRAQSERMGSPILQTPDYLRGLIKAVIQRGQK